MTEVLAQGGDRQPRRFGSVVAGAAALALLGIGLAAARSPGEPSRVRPSPPASPTSGAGWTEYPSRHGPGPDPFEVYVSAARPPDGAAVPLSIDRGVPVFLVMEGGAPRVYEAVGGPDHARTLLGWCARNRTLQDPSGRWYYSDGVPSEGAGPLRTYPARDGVGTRGQVDIGLSARIVMPGAHVLAGEPCRAAELVMPPRTRVSRTSSVPRFALARVAGTYTVTHEGVSFCPDRPDAVCVRADRPPLPPDDLAASYTWEGEFLVREIAGLTVVLTPQSRLVRRDGVGARAVAGAVESSYVRGGVTYVRFSHERGGVSDYAVRADVTLLGGADLRGQRDRGPTWLVLDAAGRVMRAVRRH